MTQNRFYSSVAAKTTLVGTINASVTTMAVASVTGFPASLPFTLILERDTANEEVVTVTGVSTLTLTVTRAQDGTTGVSHTTGATVEHGVSARDFNEPQAHIAATGAVHGLTGSIVGTTDVQTLSGKTLTAPVIATISNTGTLTLPTSTDTLVGRATTDTLSNKTLTSPVANGAVLDAASTVGGVSGTSLVADRGVWTSYVPALTNTTGGGGVFYYRQAGKTLFVRGYFNAGTATATAAVTVALPAAVTSVVGASQPLAGLDAIWSVTGASTVVTSSSVTAGQALTGIGFNGVIEIQ